MPVRSIFWRLSKREEGQILLVVILVMVTSLTVGLALISRSITNTKTSAEEANSQKALSAAEAGIEKEIQTGGVADIPLTTFSNNNTKYSATVTSVSSASIALKNDSTVLADEPVDVWLVDYSTFSAGSGAWSGNSVTVSWGSNPSDPCQDSALEILVLRTPRAAPILDRWAIDGCARTPANNFDSAGITNGSHTVAGKTFAHKVTISFAAGTGLLMRIIPIYKPTTIGVVGNVSFPSQGFVINSTGLSGSTARTIQVYQGYPEIPAELFPYNLFLP